eukprot:7053094-Pyramimonas_sp.AAC.1
MYSYKETRVAHHHLRALTSPPKSVSKASALCAGGEDQLGVRPVRRLYSFFASASALAALHCSRSHLRQERIAHAKRRFASGRVSYDTAKAPRLANTNM